MPEISLKCDCGKVRGYTKNITSESGVRIVCHCDDCQNFARYLTDRTPASPLLLDEFGGTDIFQMPIAHLKIEQGQDQLRCIRLTDKGIFRWYTACCNTPVGNTLGSKMAFVGVIHNFMYDKGSRNENLGPVKGYLQTNHAIKPVMATPNHDKFPLGLTLKIVSNLLIWKFKGLNKPSVFFNSNGEPVSSPKILNS